MASGFLAWAPAITAGALVAGAGAAVYLDSAIPSTAAHGDGPGAWQPAWQPGVPPPAGTPAAAAPVLGEPADQSGSAATPEEILQRMESYLALAKQKSANYFVNTQTKRAVADLKRLDSKAGRDMTLLSNSVVDVPLFDRAKAIRKEVNELLTKALDRQRVLDAASAAGSAGAAGSAAGAAGSAAVAAGGAPTKRVTFGPAAAVP